MLRARAVLAAVALTGCGTTPSPNDATAPASPSAAASPVAPAGPPVWSTEFAGDEGLWDLGVRGGGRVTFGVSDAAASDAVAGALLFPGDPRFGSADRVGPGFATEIDIEILCATPSFISLSAWTDYSDARFLKLTRVVDFATGDYFESPSDHEYGIVRKGNLPEFRHPGFPDPNTFYEMGFEWHPTRVRFFIVVDGREIELWSMTDARYVPQRSSAWLFNVWHPQRHWFGPAADGDADYPAQNAEMRIDWARYWPE